MNKNITIPLKNHAMVVLVNINSLSTLYIKDYFTSGAVIILDNGALFQA